MPVPPYPARAAFVPSALLVALLGAGCTGPAPSAAGPATPVPAAAGTPAASPVAPPPADGSGGHGRGGDRGGTPTAPAIPAGWPADVPVPPGVVQGSTGGAAQWTVLLLEPGPAADVQRSTVAFYVAAGFAEDPAQILRRGSYAITVGAENRDHSAAETNLSIGLVQH